MNKTRICATRNYITFISTSLSWAIWSFYSCFCVRKKIVLINFDKCTFRIVSSLEMFVFIQLLHRNIILASSDMLNYCSFGCFDESLGAINRDSRLEDCFSIPRWIPPRPSPHFFAFRTSSMSATNKTRAKKHKINQIKRREREIKDNAHIRTHVLCLLHMHVRERIAKKKTLAMLLAEKLHSLVKSVGRHSVAWFVTFADLAISALHVHNSFPQVW